MPRASAEADAALIDRLRTKFAHIVSICGVPEIIQEAPPIYLVTLDSPLIHEDMGVVEIVVERDGLRFKPWREA